MYEQAFNLTSRPFTSTHYVKHYFPAAAIDQSLQQCKMIVERGAGPVIVVGDHGTGKTLLLAMLEDNFKSQYRVVNISASLIRGREDLLQNILYQLQLNCRGLGENEMRLDLIEYLKADQSGGILLMVDDAQKLGRETIEEMQLLTDFIRDGQPRVRLVVAGTQALEERLADTRLVSFNQRVAGRCFLCCLSRDEVEAYVRAHLERAGGQPDELFTPESYRAIYEVTEGKPRYINQVCDHAMIFSATRGIVPVTDSLVREAWFDIQNLPGSVAPAGSGASMSDSGLAQKTIETEDNEGWTVLEFGELSDADSFEDGVPATSVEDVANVEEPIVETAPVEAPAVEPVAELPAQPETIPGPSFSVGPMGEVQSLSQTPADDAAPSIPVQVDASEVSLESNDDAGIDVPTAAGGAAILASAMAGFGLAQGDAQNESTEVSAPESIEPVAELSSAEEVQAAANFAVPAESPMPASTSFDEAPAVEPYESPVETSAVQSAPVQPAPIQSLPVESVVPEPVIPEPVAEDPFATDDFENEEVLTDAYSPFVAQQNQKSLDVTTEQLQNLNPQDVFVTNEAPAAEVDSAIDNEEESFPTFDTAMQAPEPVREPIKPQLDPRETEETRQLNDELGPNSLSEEFLLNRPAALMENDSETFVGHPEAAKVSSVDLEPVEAAVGSGFVPLDPDAEPVPPIQQAAPEMETPATSPTAPVPLMPPPQFLPDTRMPEPTGEQDVVPPVADGTPYLVDSAPLEPGAALPAPIEPVNSLPDPVKPVSPEAASPQQAESVPVVQENAIAFQPPQIVAPTVSTAQIPTPEIAASSAPLSTQQSVAPNIPSVADPAAETPVAEQPVAAEPEKFHEQAPSPDDPEIRRQAEEIIRSLAAASTTEEPEVSHETPAAPVAIEEETNAIESTIQRSIAAREIPEEPARVLTPPVVMPDLGQIKESLRQAQEGQGYAQVPPTQSVPEPTPVPSTAAPASGAGKIPVHMADDDATMPERRILEEVQEQVSMVTPPIPMSLVQETPVDGQDDRDILDMNKEQPPLNVAGKPPEPTPLPAWSKQEPSQGEAARVDYQKLFDQLRNVQSNQNS
ncbi:ExeA family protein [Mariniblastus fucicola]|uniref:AAA+ ATPase domain-containing protein n=1 Tax=Mariniblastus fucicola TaxID=980251 RepID=A0A5B9P5J3_9BACT|nr:AAA family ATPase [Mariniblastus fucicola]QEG21847.1 hypothetical protein MFFC18_17080 [Mariniblastus fucicola]